MTSSDSSTPAGSLRFGLFDIMQIDPLRGDDVASMYAQRLDDLAVADEFGFDIAFCAERHFLPNFAAASATAWIAAASQRTTRMRLGAMGYTLPMKAPVQLAEDVAILDLLSRGRLEVGFGLGHRIEELVALGIDPGQRINLFMERLAVLRALWTGGQVRYEHGDIIIREVMVSPQPVQEPHPPLWFAGTEPAAAEWMGANGLGLALGFKPTEQLKPAAAAFITGRESRSEEIRNAEPERRAGTIALMRSVIVGDSDHEVRNLVIDDLVRLSEAARGEQSEGSRADRKREAREQYEAMVVSDVMIAGSVDTVAGEIRASQGDLRFDLFLASVYAMGASTERVRTTMKLLTGPVREQLRSAPSMA